MTYTGMNTHEYFLTVGKIWRDYANGKLTEAERDKLLRPYRAIVHTCVPSNFDDEGD